MPYALTKSPSVSTYQSKQSDSVCGRPRRAFGALPQFLRYIAYSPLRNSDKLAKVGRAAPASLGRRPESPATIRCTLCGKGLETRHGIDDPPRISGPGPTFRHPL